MTLPYSWDLRDRAVALVVAGETVRAVAAALRGALRAARNGRIAFARRAARRLERWGAIGPVPSDWRTLGVAFAADRQRAERGVKVSDRAVWTFVPRERIGYKRTRIPAGQNRPGVARHRAGGKRDQGKIDPKCLVFIDETWVILRQARDQDAPWTRLGTSLDHFAPRDCALFQERRRCVMIKVIPL